MIINFERVNENILIVDLVFKSYSVSEVIFWGIENYFNYKMFGLMYVIKGLI